MWHVFSIAIHFLPSTPSVQAVTLRTEFGLAGGTFVLSLEHRNESANSTQVFPSCDGANLVLVAVVRAYGVWHMRTSSLMLQAM